MLKNLRGASTIVAPWTLFHIVIYSFSDSSNKEAMPIFAIESTTLQNNKGPWLLPIFVFIDLAYLQTVFKLSFQQVPADHKVALKVITYVGCALSLVGEALTAVAFFVLLWVTDNIKLGHLDLVFVICRIIKVEVSAFNSRILVSSAPSITRLRKSETKIVACNKQ